MPAWDHFLERIAGTLGIKDGHAFSLGKIAAADLPTCNATRQFEKRAIPGAAGVADREVRCEKNAGNTFAWVDVPAAPGPPFDFLPVFNVKHYGAVGDGTTTDTTAIAAALTAADGVDGTVFFPSGSYKTTAALTVPAGVTVQGEGASSIIKPSGTGFAVLTHTGNGGNTSTLASNANENEVTITLTAGGVASTALVVGSYVRIFDTTASGKSQITKVKSIAGEVVTLVDPLSETFTTALTASVRRLIPDANIVIRDLAIDGTNLTNGGAEAHAIYFNTMRHCLLADLRISNMDDAGILLQYGYGNVVKNVDLLACGSPSYADLDLAWQANFQIDGVRSVSPTGFGPTFKECQHGEGSSIHTSGAFQRAFKLQACAHNRFANIAANYSETLTGLGIVYGSHHNYFDGVDAIGNLLEGIWFYGDAAPAVSADHHNILTNVRAANNGSYEVALNTGCDANLVMGDFDIAGTFDYRQLGTNNVIIVANSSAGYHVRGEMTVSPVDQTSGDGVATEHLHVDTTGVTVGSLAGVGSRTVVADANGLISAGSATSPGTIVVQEGDSTVSTAGTIDFDASDFNVTDSPSGEANIALAYGTGAGTPAEGNHAHTGTYQPLDSDLTTLAANITAAGHALVDDATVADQRTTLGLVAAGAGDIWVEKAGDTMTGDLTMTTTSGQRLIDIQSRQATGTAWPEVRMYRSGAADVATPNSEVVAQWKVDGRDSANAACSFADIFAQIGTNAAGSAPTTMTLRTTASGSGTLVSRQSWSPTESIINDSGADADTRIEGVGDANLLFVDAGAASVAIGNNAPTSWLDLKAGTTARAPMRIPSGTNLTTPLAGAVEFDGTGFSETVNATEGRMRSGATSVFYLTGNGGTISTIANFFGSTSAFATVTNGVYELTYHCFFLNTTAGTLVWTITNTQAWANVVGSWDGSPVGGVTAVGGIVGAGSGVATTTAGFALPTTGTLTDNTRHYHRIRVFGECGTAGNIRLNATKAVGGTITPLRGSYYTVRRVSGNSGAFVA